MTQQYIDGYQDAIHGLDEQSDDYDYLLGYTDGDDTTEEFGYE